MHINKKIRGAVRATAILTAVCWAGCVFNITDSDNALTLSIANESTGLCASPALTVVLSCPAVESTVVFTVDPPVQFIASAHAGCDTFTIRFRELLKPSTQYHICLDSGVRGTNKQPPDEDNGCALFTTGPYTLEQEPNDNPATADTLKEQAYGFFWSANDTDYFVCDLPDSAFLVLESVETIAALVAADSAGTVIATLVPTQTGRFSTQPVPRSDNVRLKLFPVSRSTGVGFYAVTVSTRFNR